jgi:membrane associated rhomboid family serine protease
MRGRYPSPSGIAYSFGPGPLTPAIKILVIANVAVFLVSFVLRLPLEDLFGMSPALVVERFQLWRPLTYMFLHGGLFHLLFNMLALWMFGVELERMWGSKYFTKYYFVAGVGGAATQLVFGLASRFVFGDPAANFDPLYHPLTVGASGAVYGILLAYALYFPHRELLFMMLFPIKAKYYVMLVGAIALMSSMGVGDGVAHAAHLGGLIAGYLYLKGGRMHLLSEIQYRYLKWRINRSRRRFDVYNGGRADNANRRVH